MVNLVFLTSDVFTLKFISVEVVLCKIDRLKLGVETDWILLV